MVIVCSLQASAIDVSSSLSVGQEYTDNRCLTPSDKEGEWVSTITPRIDLSSETVRTSLDVRGSVQFNSKDQSDCPASSNFGREGNRDRVNPNLTANGSLEVVRQHFFIDADAYIRKNSVDPFSSYSDSSGSGRGNSNLTRSYTISPYLVGKVGGLFQYTLRASYDDQTNDARQINNSDEEAVYLSIVGIMDSPFSWSIDGSYRREDYDQDRLQPGEENELSSASVTLGYQINPKWQVNATAGEDFNEFTTITNETEGSYWDVGFSWKPNRRTSVRANYGDRFFGDSSSLQLTHQLRRSSFDLSYERSITTTRSLRTEDVFIPIVDAEGNPFLIDGNPVFFPSFATTLTRSPIVEERLQAGYRLKGVRSSIGFDVSMSDQQRLEDNRETSFYTYTISADRKLSRNLTLNGRISYDERQADRERALGRDSETTRYSVGLRRALGANTDLVFDYSYIDRTESGGRDYEENQFIVTFNINFD